MPKLSNAKETVTAWIVPIQQSVTLTPENLEEVLKTFKGTVTVQYNEVHQTVQLTTDDVATHARIGTVFAAVGIAATEQKVYA